MMLYLETMCGVWPVRLRILKAKQAGDLYAAAEIAKDLSPIIIKARKPLNEALFWRYKAKELYEARPEFRADEDRRIAKDFVRFINHWCYTSDPRIVSFGLPSMLPFVLWPKQEEFLMWMHDFYTNGGSWLVEKSRGWGLTWLMAAYYVWHWLFHDGFIGGFGSRDKDAVDKIDDPDTIFAKVRFIIYNLPQAMLPKSYQGKSLQERASSDSYLRITNPDRDSTIRGEGGENIGAGGRGSIYFVDEHALIEHPEAIDDSLSGTTNCIGYGSTVRGMNNFGEKRHSGRIPVFTCWFYQDPGKYHGWRDGKLPTRDQCAFLDHEFLDKGALVVAQEILIDYNRSVDDSFIPADWVKAAVDFEIPAEGDRQSGFDVSGDGDNKSVYTFRIGPTVCRQTEFAYATMQENLEHALSCADEDRTDQFSYDASGIGGPIWGHIKFTERKLRFNLDGIKGNSSASERYLFPEGVQAKDKFFNKRAENCWNLRERFRKTFEHRRGVKIYDYAELISIPNEPKLIMQLSQPKLLPRNKIQVESKVDMKARGVKSPDRFDSLVNAFADPDRASLVVSSFNYRDGSGTIEEFDINPENPALQHYVSLVTDKDMMTYALGCVWLPAASAPRLRIFCDYMMPASDVKRLVATLKEVMIEAQKPIREWICNEEMIDSLEDGKDSMWQLYRREKVSLRKNYTLDYSTSITVTNQLFANGIIKLHPRCERPMMQLSNWRLENGKPQSGLGFATALCQLVTRLRTRKEILTEHISPSWEPRNPYRGGGTWAQKAKPGDGRPSYMALAEKQVKQRG